MCHQVKVPDLKILTFS